MSKKNKISYKTSGVDIEKGDALVEFIKPLAKKTSRPEVKESIGGFSAISSIPSKYKDPLIVSATDGVGTKIEIAELMNNHSTIGQDLVAMCVNDLITCGAEPIFFLDYLVTERINILKTKEIIKGIAKGCEIANCSLIGGETAEHPNAFPREKYDLAGFCEGIVEKENALKTLGFDQVTNVRQGKFIEIELDEKDPTKAEKQVAKMSETLLANTVIEDYQIDIQESK